MVPNERRLKIIELLCQRRHETMENLSFEFDVNIRTIRRDIEELSLSYPLETVRGRYGGGIQVPNNFKLYQKYLSSEQQELLEQLRTSLNVSDLVIMNSILNDFALKK